MEKFLEQDIPIGETLEGLLIRFVIIGLSGARFRRADSTNLVVESKKEF